MTILEDDSLGDAARVLADAGIANSRHEARLLQALAAGDDTCFVDYVRRRAAHEPYSRIRGAREFWSLDFALSPDTLDPRPDSETLIEAALASLPNRAAPLCILDLGTGTGALLLAMLSEFPNAIGLGIDLLPGAVKTAQHNAVTLGLASRARFVAGDWAATDLGCADVILSNPPYISMKALTELPPDVTRFDPRVALDGGCDGLDAYRVLAPILCHALQPSGTAFFEVGAGQADAVAAIMMAFNLYVTGRHRDLAGHERCVAFRQEESGNSAQD